MEVCACVFVYLRVLMDPTMGEQSLNYPDMGYLFWSCWLIVSHESQALQVIASTLGYPLDLDGKTLLLKIPHS